MNEQSTNQERMTTILSKELRVLRANIKQLQRELDQERGKNGMLTYLLGLGGDRVDERDKLILILQEKVLQTISMLESSADPQNIVKVLKEDVDFCKAHPTFELGMNQRKVTARSGVGDKMERPSQ